MATLAIRAGTFQADTDVGETVRVTWTGECDLEAADELEAFFEGVHAAATATSPSRDVFFDLTAVDFMSSSCLSKLVAWLARVRDLDAATGYKVRIRSNPTVPWQKRSLRAVQFFAPALVTLET